MKTIFIILIFWLAYSQQGYAQDTYQTFRTEMSGIEKQEQELRQILWGKNEPAQAHRDSVYQIYKVLVNDKKDFALKAVRDNPGDKRFLKVLDIYVRNFLSLDEFETELKHFTPEVQQTDECQKNFKFIEYARQMQIGKPYTDFEMKGHQDEKIILSKILKKNKVVLIDFWASWCGACRASLPHLKSIYETYRKDGLEIVSVSLDDKKADWDKAYQQEKLPWIDGSNLLGWQDPLTLKYAIRGIPHQVLIDHKGIIQGTEFYEYGSLEKALKKCLK